jgi:hypothetical protein
MARLCCARPSINKHPGAPAAAAAPLDWSSINFADLTSGALTKVIWQPPMICTMICANAAHGEPDVTTAAQEGDTNK